MQNDILQAALTAALLNQTTTTRNALSRIRNNIKSGKPEVITAQARSFAQIALDSALAAEALFKNEGQSTPERQMRRVRMALAHIVHTQDERQRAKAAAPQKARRSQAKETR